MSAHNKWAYRGTTITGASISGANGNTDSGWLLGVGVERVFASNWSAKVDYDYLGLSGRTY